MTVVGKIYMDSHNGTNLRKVRVLSVDAATGSCTVEALFGKLKGTIYETQTSDLKNV